MAEWLEGRGRITLLAKESVAWLLAFLASVTAACHTADGAPSPPAGPPLGTNFSRRQATAPSPPSPPRTLMRARSMKVDTVSLTQPTGRGTQR